MLGFEDGAAAVASAATQGALAGIIDDVDVVAHPPAPSVSHPETLLLHNLDVLLPEVPPLLATGVPQTSAVTLAVASGEGWGGFMRPVVHQRQNKAPCPTAESNAVPIEFGTVVVSSEPPAYIHIQLSADVFLCITARHRTSSQRHKRYVPSPLHPPSPAHLSLSPALPLALHLAHLPRSPSATLHPTPCCSVSKGGPKPATVSQGGGLEFIPEQKTGTTAVRVQLRVNRAGYWTISSRLVWRPRAANGDCWEIAQAVLDETYFAARGSIKTPSAVKAAAAEREALNAAALDGTPMGGAAAAQAAPKSAPKAKRRPPKPKSVTARFTMDMAALEYDDRIPFLCSVPIGPPSAAKVPERRRRAKARKSKAKARPRKESLPLVAQPRASGGEGSAAGQHADATDTLSGMLAGVAGAGPAGQAFDRGVFDPVELGAFFGAPVSVMTPSQQQMAQQQMAQQAYRVRLQQQQMAQQQSQREHAAISGAPYFMAESRGEAGSLGALRPGLGAGGGGRPSGLSSGSLIGGVGMMSGLAGSMDGASGRAERLSSSELGQSLPSAPSPAGGMSGMAQMGSFGDLGSVANGYASFAQTAAFYAQPGRYSGGQLSGAPLLASMQRSRSRNDSESSMAGMSAAMGMQGMQGMEGMQSLGVYPNVYGNAPGGGGAAMGGFGSGGNLYGRTMSNNSVGAERVLKKSRQRSISGNGASTGWLNALVGNDVYSPGMLGMSGSGHIRSFSGSDPSVRNFSEGSSSGDHALAAVAANAAAAVAAAGADVRRRSSDLSTVGSGGAHSRASSASELEAAAGLSSLVSGGRNGSGVVNVSGLHHVGRCVRMHVRAAACSRALRSCTPLTPPPLPSLHAKNRCLKGDLNACQSIIWGWVASPFKAQRWSAAQPLRDLQVARSARAPVETSSRTGCRSPSRSECSRGLPRNRDN